MVQDIGQSLVTGVGWEGCFCLKHLMLSLHGSMVDPSDDEEKIDDDRGGGGGGGGCLDWRHGIDDDGVNEDGVDDDGFDASANHVGQGEADEGCP